MPRRSFLARLITALVVVILGIGTTFTGIASLGTASASAESSPVLAAATAQSSVAPEPGVRHTPPSAAAPPATRSTRATVRYGAAAAVSADLCPVKGGKYLAKIPVIRRAIDRIGNWIKPGETVAQRSARYAK